MLGKRGQNRQPVPLPPVQSANVAHGLLVELDNPPLIILKPGESRNEQVAISSACDLSQPGQYRIRVLRYDPAGPKQGVIRSKEIAVTVKP